MEAPDTRTQLNVYLMFDGNCEEAIHYYKGIFGGEVQQLSRFGEGPMEVGEEYKDKVMHVNLVFDELTLLASDVGPGTPYTPGNAVQLSLYFGDRDRAAKILADLSNGGQVTMPFEDVFWGGKFGMVTDKYGHHWMISSN